MLARLNNEMHQDTLTKVVAEFDSVLTGRFVRRIFQLSPSSLVIDFGVREAGYLMISVNPADPRMHLIKRSARFLQQSSLPPGQFAQFLRSAVDGGHLKSVKQDAGERIVRLLFSVTDDIGATFTRTLVAQLTGRSANLYLLDNDGRITHALRRPKGEGQQIGDGYQAPLRSEGAVPPEVIRFDDRASISEALDKYYQLQEKRNELAMLVKNVSGKLRKDIARLRKLKAHLLKDLAGHGNPDDHKRLGDLLLANITTNERMSEKVLLKDYFAEGEPTIEVEIDEGKTLQQAATESFARYGKSKRAIDEIGSRLVQIDEELRKLQAKQAELEKAIAAGEEHELKDFAVAKPAAAPNRDTKKPPARLPGMRHYRSSDGFEIIVGRAARDNDTLTFRVAKPNDLWLHAGDYPGSHVVVRNASRKDIPHRTIIEAAQLAAKFSQAGEDSKVTVHYTPRKFLSKPKGAAPGLVRMSTFRSIAVAPGENIERM